MWLLVFDIIPRNYPKTEFFQLLTRTRVNMFVYLFFFIYNLLSHVQSDGWKTSAAPTQVFDLINLLANLLVPQIHLVCSYL